MRQMLQGAPQPLPVPAGLQAACGLPWQSAYRAHPGPGPYTTWERSRSSPSPATVMFGQQHSMQDEAHHRASWGR